MTFSYANDTSINIQIHSGYCNENVAKKVDEFLSYLEQFFKLNNLKLNVGKTVIMRITMWQKSAKNPKSIVLETKDDKGKSIVPAETAKTLGITIKRSLNWNYHLDKGKEGILNKCKKKLGALKNVANQACLNTKKRLVEGCIMSVLVYEYNAGALWPPNPPYIGSKW